MSLTGRPLLRPLSQRSSPVFYADPAPASPDDAVDLYPGGNPRSCRFRSDTDSICQGIFSFGQLLSEILKVYDDHDLTLPATKIDGAPTFFGSTDWFFSRFLRATQPAADFHPRRPANPLLRSFIRDGTTILKSRTAAAAICDKSDVNWLGLDGA